MNRKRKIYLGMTLLSGVGFAVDRLLLDSPAPAAAETTETAEGEPKARPTSASKELVQLPDPSVERLEAMTELPVSRDIFRPSPQMLRLYQKLDETAAAASPDKGPRPGSPEEFAAQHQLQATSSLGGKVIAIVDGRPLRVGETLHGFQLTRITATSVEFRRGREGVTLQLPELHQGR